MAQKNKVNYSPYKRKNQGKAQKRSRGHLISDVIYSTQEANDRLFDIFKNHDFSHIEHHERLAMAHYYQLLMLEQQNQNFTRLMKFRDIAIKHFIDCAIVKDLCDLQFPLMDLGSGPGLPGIVLKILYPEEKIFLAESVWRRVEFLQTVREKMNLENLHIFGRSINPTFFYPVRGVISRAVEDISNTLNNIKHCLQVGGKVYFMKGPNVDVELQAALQNHSDYYQLVQDHSYQLPRTSHQRRLLVFEKIQAHPQVDLEKILDLDYGDENED
mgnify:CR=1 FL=1|tara:strand:- start:5103 stop:5915 length:813 start_codon:yes stop_codon:yes gene_type:complete